LPLQWVAEDSAPRRPMGDFALQRVVVITGYGKIFSAGADLNEIAEFVLNEKNMSHTEQRDAALKFCRVGQELILRLRRFPKPVTALVNGACLGGGLELALGCHKIIATPDAYLGLPEITRGLIPGWGGTYFLSRRVDLERAKAMITLGAPVTAQKALEFGLIDKLLPGQGEQQEFAFPPVAPRLMTAVPDFLDFQFHGYGDDVEDALEEAALYFAHICVIDGSEAKEGILAFREKREPKFK